MEETFLRWGQIVRVIRVRLFLPLGLLATTIFVACSTTARWAGRDPVKSTLPRSSNLRLAEANLIRISEVDRSIAIDLRYTRESAIAKKPLYSKNMPALLRPETAVRLRKANEQRNGVYLEYLIKNFQFEFVNL